MSFDPVRWAMLQPIEPALTKFCLVAMAIGARSDGQEVSCGLSYASLARSTGMNSKTVEGSVTRLKGEGYIVDTGRRAGDTGKVVIYRFNDPKSGVVATGPEGEGGGQLQHANDPKSGVVTPVGNPPKSDANPPKNSDQSPQKVEESTPLSGSLPLLAGTPLSSVPTADGKKKKREPRADASRPADVAEPTWASWLALRRKKRATVDDTVIAMAREQAGLAGVTLDRFLCLWAARGSQGLQAEWLTQSERGQSATATGKHAGFTKKNYREGVSDDGSFN